MQAANGGIEAMNGLVNIHLVGIKEPLSGVSILLPNISQALELIEWGVSHNNPKAVHLMGEIIHFGSLALP